METRSRPLRFRVRTLLVAVALVGLVGAPAASGLDFRAVLQRERDGAGADLQKARAAADLYIAEVAARSVSSGGRDDRARRELLEGGLRSYEATEPRVASPEARARILDRIRQVRTELQDKGWGDEGDPRER